MQHSVCLVVTGLSEAITVWNVGSSCATPEAGQNCKDCHQNAWAPKAEAVTGSKLRAACQVKRCHTQVLLHDFSAAVDKVCCPQSSYN